LKNFAEVANLSQPFKLKSFAEIAQLVEISLQRLRTFRAPVVVRSCPLEGLRTSGEVMGGLPTWIAPLISTNSGN
jgi:hypothetical protein